MSRLRLLPDTFRLPGEQQLQLAQQAVRQHMAESGGELNIWGRIQHYLFCYAEDRKLALSTSGEVVGDASATGISQASATLKGKPLPLPTLEGEGSTLCVAWRWHSQDSHQRSPPPNRQGARP